MDRMANLRLHPEIPMVISGNWNLHHNLWNSAIEAESTLARTQDIVNWLEGHGFNLCNERDVHTRSGSGTQRDTIIDLTFSNEMATGQGLVQKHKVNLDLMLLSDHHALTYMLGDPRESVDNITKAKYNWKDANEEKFVEALKQELHLDEELFDISIQQVLNSNHTQASLEELDSVVKFLNSCMEQAAAKTVPTHRMCSRSKPWWNNDLTTAFKDMRAARDMARSYYKHFNCQIELMTSEVHQLCKKALHMVKTAKHEYYLKLTEGANMQ